MNTYTLFLKFVQVEDFSLLLTVKDIFLILSYGVGYMDNVYWLYLSLET